MSKMSSIAKGRRKRTSLGAEYREFVCDAKRCRFRCGRVVDVVK
jgi:hypothetical protein